MRVALIDADIVAYKCAFLSEEAYDFGDTGVASLVDEPAARQRADQLVNEYADTVGADRIVICLTDERNFRKELNPSYKSNRANQRKPELLSLVKEYLAFEYRSYIRPRLEADDCMGILATRPSLLGKAVTEAVIVSEDKDMLTIPGLVYNPNRHDMGVREISREQANRFLCMQTLVGDQVDGYPGCPGVGPLSPYVEHLATLSDPHDLWYCVVDCYGDKGFGEEEALLQARMAHILRYSSYNFQTKKIRLWTPLHMMF